MQTFVSLLAATLLASQTFASPLPQSSSSRKFTVNQSVAKKGKTGVQALAAAYAKFGQTVPEDIANAADGGTGSVTATPETGDVEYLCPVVIGGQTVNLDFDTGSADL
jgi:aspergillopepsin I